MKFVDDTELAYVMQRYREVHDFVHTLAGLSIRFDKILKINLAETFDSCPERNSGFCSPRRKDV